jgi:hypothetical protein
MTANHKEDPDWRFDNLGARLWASMVATGHTLLLLSTWMVVSVKAFLCQRHTRFWRLMKKLNISNIIEMAIFCVYGTKSNISLKLILSFKRLFMWLLEFLNSIWLPFYFYWAALDYIHMGWDWLPFAHHHKLPPLLLLRVGGPGLFPSGRISSERLITQTLITEHTHAECLLYSRHWGQKVGPILKDLKPTNHLMPETCTLNVLWWLPRGNSHWIPEDQQRLRRVGHCTWAQKDK